MFVYIIDRTLLDNLIGTINMQRQEKKHVVVDCHSIKGLLFNYC